jgi:hypothetical protein
MNLTIPILLFLAGFGSGAWLAGTKGRSLLASAAPLPLLVIAAAVVLIVYELSRPRVGENMTDLAVIATATIGGLFALIAFAGGLFGARWRRAGRQR